MRDRAQVGKLGLSAVSSFLLASVFANYITRPFTTPRYRVDLHVSTITCSGGLGQLLPHVPLPGWLPLPVLFKIPIGGAGFGLTMATAVAPLFAGRFWSDVGTRRRFCRAPSAWIGTARIGALFLIWRTVMLHEAGRFRILLRVPRRYVHPQTVGAVEAPAAMLAAYALKRPRGGRGSGSALDMPQMLFQTALRKHLTTIDAYRILGTLPWCHFYDRRPTVSPSRDRIEAARVRSTAMACENALPFKG